MKNISKLIFILVASSLILLNSCIEDFFNGCLTGDYYAFYESNALRFEFLDKDTKENILHIRNIDGYFYDSLIILNSENKPLYDNSFRTVGNDGRASLYFLNQDDDGLVNERVHRRYFFYFNHMDQDTIDIEFEMKYDKCDEQRISYINIVYNDSSYFEGHVDYVPFIQFFKTTTP